VSYPLVARQPHPSHVYTGRGNAAYNASKAAVKSMTEGLAYELRERPDTHLTAHLFMYVTSTYQAHPLLK
jgi:NAD(P)-dependent dehydrogenase (short-subunit alcohol dehydrogenase family)